MDLIVGLDHLNLLIHRRRGACAPLILRRSARARVARSRSEQRGAWSRGRHHQLHLTSTTDRNSVEHPPRLAAESAFRLGKRSNGCAAHWAEVEIIAPNKFAEVRDPLRQPSRVHRKNRRPVQFAERAGRVGARHICSGASQTRVNPPARCCVSGDGSAPVR